MHFSAAAAVHGVLSLRAAWRRGEEVTARLALPEGESNATIQTEASAAQVRLWWPNGLGRQPLYNLTVSFTPDAPPLLAGDNSLETRRAKHKRGFSAKLKLAGR